jgi:tRNA-Thr(GGU) m(6)t(6)A37 methyltransferase TsaA
MTDPPAGSYGIHPVGIVRSPLRHAGQAPRQGDEGAPAARIEIAPSMIPALAGLVAGDRIVVVTWLHLADRRVLRTRPRGDPGRSAAGVFATRSQDRPNPIGLHPCTVVDIDSTGLDVDALEAVDGTPVVDIKCALLPLAGR